MKNLLVLAVALFATNAFAAEMKWNGSAGWRGHEGLQNGNLGILEIEVITGSEICVTRFGQ